MSMLWMENFQFYGVNGEAEMLKGTPWANIHTSGSGGLSADPDGVSPTSVLRLSGQGLGANSSRFTIPTAGDVHNLGFRLWLPALPPTNSKSFGVAFKDSGNNHKYLLRTNPSGYLILERTNGCGTDISSTDESNGDVVEVANTNAQVIGAGTWYHIEWMMNRTTGAYEVRVEGQRVLSGTDGSAATGNNAIVEFLDCYNASAGANDYPYIKDIFIADDAGSVNNGFIGPVSIITLQVDGDVSSGWARSTGSADYSLIDELTPNDADYIEADDAPPAPSILTLENLPTDVVGVRALQPIVRRWKIDGGDATLQVGLVSGTAEDDGSDDAPGTAAAYQWDISEIDPDTSAQWTPSGVNSASISVDRTT